MRWLRRIVYVLIGLIVIVVGTGWYLLAGSEAQLDGTVTTPGLSAPVTITRDHFGVVTVDADNRRDLAWATGFVHAQERFFQMDLQRRLAAGELAALLGPAALKADLNHRRHRFRERAEQYVKALPPVQHALLDAYRDGVNAGLAHLRVRPWEYLLLGTKPRPWRDADTLLTLDAMFLNLNGDGRNARELDIARMRAVLPDALVTFLLAPAGRWEAPLQGQPSPAPVVAAASVLDLRRAPSNSLPFKGANRRGCEPQVRAPMSARGRMPRAGLPCEGRTPELGNAGVGMGSPAVAARQSEFPGSNNFAVAGTLTGGSAIVANDMHLHLGVPNIWFRMRLRYTDAAGERIDLNGVTLPGVPALVAGSNGHIAWGFTNSYGDWMDWVRVRIDPDHPDRYRVPGGWAPLQRHVETIAVKGGAPHRLVVRDTRWGPIMAKAPDGTPLALAWIAQSPRTHNLNLLKLEQVHIVAQALAVAPTMGMPPQNFVVGDRAGNIGWTVTGNALPLRAGYDPTLPADWSTPGTGWIGWATPAQFPRIENPADGRLWTANNRTTSGAWLALLGNGGYALGARAQQIRNDLRTPTLPPLQGGESARLRTAGSRADERPRQDAEGRVALRGPDARAWQRGGGDGLTPRAMLAIQLDDRAVFLTRWQHLLQTTLAAHPDPALAQLRKLTAHWHDRAAVSSVDYRLVRAFRRYVTQDALAPFMARVRKRFAHFQWPGNSEAAVWALLQRRPPWLLDRRYANWDALMLHAAQQVVDELGSRPGGLAAQTWGERNTAAIHHPLAGALPWPFDRWLSMPADQLPGDSNMPRVQAPSFGASERFGIIPGDEAHSYLEMPGGQSDNPLSPYFGAGHEAWVHGKATPLLPGPVQHSLHLVPVTPDKRPSGTGATPSPPPRCQARASGPRKATRPSASCLGRSSAREPAVRSRADSPP